MKFCAKCGTAAVAGSRFCKGCGAPVGAEQATAQASTPASAPAPSPASEAGPARQCPLCARTYPAGQKFCNADGAALGPAAAVAPVAPPPPAPPPPPPPLPAPEPDPAPEPEAEAEAPPPEPLACPACGLSFPPGVRFCDRDGTPLVPAGEVRAAIPAAPPPTVSSPLPQPDAPEPVGGAEPAWSGDWEDDDEPKVRGRRVVPILLSALALLVAGGGLLVWSGQLSRWLGSAPDPELTAQSGAPAADGAQAGTGPASNAAAQTPGLQGRYTAHLSDQDITLVIEGSEPRPLVSSAGTISYVNVVNGATCTAALMAVSGGGVGGMADNTVSFRQAPVPGKPACPQDIPVKMDITGQPANANRIAQSIRVEWLSPSSDKVLMAGTLQRGAGQ